MPRLAEQWACSVCKRTNDASAPVCGTCFTPHSYRSNHHTNGGANDDINTTTTAKVTTHAAEQPKPETAKQGRLGARLASTANKAPNSSSSPPSSDAPHGCSDSSIGSDQGSSSNSNTSGSSSDASGSTSTSSDPSSRLTPQYLEPFSEDRNEHPFFPPPSLVNARIFKGPQDETVSGICSNCEGALKACAAYCGVCGARRQDASVVHSIDLTEEEADTMRAELASTAGRLAKAEVPNHEPEFSKLGARLAKARSSSGAPNSSEPASADAQQGKSNGAAKTGSNLDNQSSNSSSDNPGAVNDQHSSSATTNAGSGKVLRGFKAAMAAKAAAVAAGSANKSGSNSTISWKDKSAQMKVSSANAVPSHTVQSQVVTSAGENNPISETVSAPKSAEHTTHQNSASRSNKVGGVITKPQGNASVVNSNDAASSSSSGTGSGGGKVLLGFKAAMAAKAAAVALTSAGKSESKSTKVWNQKPVQSKASPANDKPLQTGHPQAVTPVDKMKAESESSSLIPEQAGGNRSAHVQHQNDDTTAAVPTAAVPTAADAAAAENASAETSKLIDVPSTAGKSEVAPVGDANIEVPKGGGFSPPRRHSKMLWQLMSDKIRDGSPSEARRKNALTSFEEGRYSFKEV